MKLEKQVCSFELAKRLKELGFKQESLFCWSEELASQRYSEEGGGFDKDYKLRLMLSKRGSSSCSAYTVAELGEMLPSRVDYNNGILYIEHDFAASKLSLMLPCGYGEYEVKYAIHIDDLQGNEAEARAKMLVYLKENGLLVKK